MASDLDELAGGKLKPVDGMDRVPVQEAEQGRAPSWEQGTPTESNAVGADGVPLMRALRVRQFGGQAMSDVGAKRTKTNRARTAADKPTEIMRLTTQHGVTPVQAKNLLARFGKDRASLDAAAQRLKVPSH